MERKIFVLVLCLLLVGSVAFAEPVDIDLNEAKVVAEKYLDLIKVKKYQEAASNYFYYLSDYNQDQIEEEIFYLIETLKIYAEELGDITNYNYKTYKWETERRWTSGKVDSASLTLTYGAQYTKNKTDILIKIVKQDGELKVSSFGIQYPISFKGMQKMMSIQKKTLDVIKKSK